MGAAIKRIPTISQLHRKSQSAEHAGYRRQGREQGDATGPVCNRGAEHNGQRESLRRVHLSCGCRQARSGKKCCAAGASGEGGFAVSCAQLARPRLFLRASTQGAGKTEAARSWRLMRGTPMAGRHKSALRSTGLCAHPQAALRAGARGPMHGPSSARCRTLPSRSLPNRSRGQSTDGPRNGKPQRFGRADLTLGCIALTTALLKPVLSSPDCPLSRPFCRVTRSTTHLGEGSNGNSFRG